MTRLNCGKQSPRRTKYRQGYPFIDGLIPWLIPSCVLFASYAHHVGHLPSISRRCTRLMTLHIEVYSDSLKLPQTTSYSTSYLLEFADSHVADEWWRHVSTRPEFAQNGITRASPQYYAHQGSGDFTWASRTIPPALSGRMSVKIRSHGSTYDAISTVIAPQNVPNRVSGGWCVHTEPYE